MFYQFEERTQMLYKKDSELLTGISFFLLRKGRGIERKKMMWTTNIL